MGRFLTLIASAFIAVGINARSFHAAGPSSDEVTPPYANYFDDGQPSLDGFTLINLNDDGSTPAAVDDLKVVVDSIGRMMVNVSFTAPTTTSAGRPLTSITRIELKINDVLLHTFEAPAPGEHLSFSRKVTAKGYYTYSVVAVNEAGESLPAKAVVKAGVTRPAPVTVMSVKETANEGEVTIAWEPPAVDVDGDPLHPSVLTYSVTDNDGQLLVLNQPACSYTYQAVRPGEPQRFVGYTVTASTNSGAYIGNRASTPVIPAGPAYTIPMHESFADAPDAGPYIWSYSIPEGSTATVKRFTDDDGVSSQDGDNGLYGTVAAEKGMPALITSGKLHVGDEPNPALTFYYYAFAGGLNTIDVQIDKGDGFETVRSFVAGAAVKVWA